MGHGRKKRKIAFILIAAGAALLALVLIYTLLGDLRDGRKPEPTPSPTAAATAAPLTNTVTVAGKAVDPDTDSFDLSGRTLTEQDFKDGTAIVRKGKKTYVRLTLA